MRRRRRNKSRKRCNIYVRVSIRGSALLAGEGRREARSSLICRKVNGEQLYSAIVGSVHVSAGRSGSFGVVTGECAF